jgi:hypothetical protein
VELAVLEESSMSEIRPALTTSAEQEARNLLERMGVEDAQSFTAGDVVELANILATLSSFTWEDVDLLRLVAEERAGPFMRPTVTDLADRIEALLPPREK